jgi:putative flippase GtrA
MTRRELVADAGRFVVAGIVNTLLTFSLYQLAFLALSPMLSYTLAWLVGIGFVATVYPSRVFPGGSHTFADRLSLAISYVLVFACGLGVLHWSSEATGAPRLAIVVALVATAAVNFLVARYILRRRFS